MHLPLSSEARLEFVDTDIFTLRYFGHCMQCTTCSDWCCQWGCDVGLTERDRILAHAGALAPMVPTPVDGWFETEVEEDPEYPSGSYVRTRQVDGACVFLDKKSRGCRIHRYALEKGLDYHQIKPGVCWLFPLSFDEAVLLPSPEVQEDLVCAGDGPTIYEMVRDELAVYFSPALVAELDGIAAQVAAGQQASLPPEPAPQRPQA